MKPWKLKIGDGKTIMAIGRDLDKRYHLVLGRSESGRYINLRRGHPPEEISREDYEEVGRIIFEDKEGLNVMIDQLKALRRQKAPNTLTYVLNVRISD